MLCKDERDLGPNYLQLTKQSPDLCVPHCCTVAQARFLNKEDTDLLPPSGPSPQVTFASTNKPLRRFGFLGGGARASTLTPTSTPEEKKEPKKPVFDNIRSSLLRPTAAFLVSTQQPALCVGTARAAACLLLGLEP